MNVSKPDDYKQLPSHAPKAGLRQTQAPAGLSPRDYDEIPDPEEDIPDSEEPCYRDGALKNECWRDE